MVAICSQHKLQHVGDSNEMEETKQVKVFYKFCSYAKSAAITLVM